MDKVNLAILEILSTDNRVTIPEIGSFIRRQGTDEVVFIDLLKKNDGKLIKNIETSNSLSTEDATGIVEGYIVRINHALYGCGEFNIEGIGTLKMTQSGAVKLTKEGETESVQNSEPDNHAHQSTLFADKYQNNSVSTTKQTQTQTQHPQTPPVKTLKDTDVVEEQQHIIQAEPAEVKRTEPTTIQADSQQPKDQPNNLKQAEKHENTALKSSDADSHERDYSYSKAETQIRQTKPQQQRVANQKSVNKTQNSRRKRNSKPDMITMLAIIAAIIAIGAIIYGAFINSNPKLELPNIEYQAPTTEE